jgi:hypothetical protein
MNFDNNITKGANKSNLKHNIWVKMKNAGVNIV